MILYLDVIILKITKKTKKYAGIQTEKLFNSSYFLEFKYKLNEKSFTNLLLKIPASKKNPTNSDLKISQMSDFCNVIIRFGYVCFFIYT